MRKTVIAVAALAALGTATAATGAMARGMGSPGMHSSMAPSTGNIGGTSGKFVGNNSVGNNVHTNTLPSNTYGKNANWAGKNNGNWNGNHGQFAHRGHFRGGFGGLYAFGGPDYYDYDYNYGDTCYQRQLVQTPFGLRWRTVWVCEEAPY